MVKEMLIILASALIMLSACKGPDCEVKCNGNECACATHGKDCSKVDEDSTDLPKDATGTDAVVPSKDATKTGWLDKFHPAFEWKETNA